MRLARKVFIPMPHLTPRLATEVGTQNPGPWTQRAPFLLPACQEGRAKLQPPPPAGRQLAGGMQRPCQAGGLRAGGRRGARTGLIWARRPPAYLGGRPPVRNGDGHLSPRIRNTNLAPLCNWEHLFTCARPRKERDPLSPLPLHR